MIIYGDLIYEWFQILCVAWVNHLSFFFSSSFFGLLAWLTISSSYAASTSIPRSPITSFIKFSSISTSAVVGYGFSSTICYVSGFALDKASASYNAFSSSSA